MNWANVATLVQLLSWAATVAWQLPLVAHRQAWVGGVKSQRPSSWQRQSTASDVDDAFVNRARVWSVAWTLEADEHHPQQAAPSMRNDASIDIPSIRFLPLTESRTTERERYAAETTWNWCAHFVARHELCPWAKASVLDATAIRIYTVAGIETEPQLDTILEAVATNFAQELEQGSDSIDPNTAICFVVVVPLPEAAISDIETPNANEINWYTDFGAFYDWFVDLEEKWSLADQVTLAPFHPEWQYEGDDEASVVELEKQSPWPTISIVSTTVIDKAGPAATRRIADQNQVILLSKGMDEWKSIYNATVLQSK